MAFLLPRDCHLVPIVYGFGSFINATIPMRDDSYSIFFKNSPLSHAGLYCYCRGLISHRNFKSSHSIGDMYQKMSYVVNLSVTHYLIIQASKLDSLI